VYQAVNIINSLPVSNVNPAIPTIGADLTLASYQGQKDIPILDKASDYFCAVTKFSIPTNTIPIMIMPAIPNQSALGAPNAPNLTPLILGFQVGINSFPVQLIWTPESSATFSPPPFQDDPNNQILGEYYYYMYSYWTMINMMNTAINTAWVNSGLNAAHPGVTPPWFILNSETGIISIVVPSFMASAPSTPFLYCNDLMLSYLDGFNFFDFGPNRANGLENGFIFNQTPDKAYTLPGVPMPATPIYYKFDQDHRSLPLWSSLRRILIMSNAMPISPTFIPASGSSSGINQNGISISRPVLAEFSVNTENVDDIHSVAHYIPSAQYRLVDMISDSPLQKIDVQLYWQDILGRIFPLYLSSQQQADITIGFFRKELYTNEYKYSLP